MKKLSIMMIVFAFLLLCGGSMAFIKANSLISLLTSTSFSIALFICSIYMLKEKVAALYAATFIITGLHILFLIRFLKTFKMMPAGMMVLLTTLIGSICFSYLTKKVKEKAYE